MTFMELILIAQIKIYVDFTLHYNFLCAFSYAFNYLTFSFNQRYLVQMISSNLSHAKSVKFLLLWKD